MIPKSCFKDHRGERNSKFQDLAGREFWEERHRSEKRRLLYPRPRRTQLDADLDRVFRRHLSDRRGQRLLEAGCGSSVWLPYFAREFGMEVTGIDYSSLGLEISRRILEANNVQGRLIAGDFLAPDRTLVHAFDCVFSLGVIEHFRDPCGVVNALGDFLVPGGLLMTWIPNLSGLILRFSHRLNRALDDFYGDIDADGLLECHKNSGWEILEAHPTQFLDLTLLNVTRFPKIFRTIFARTFRAAGVIGVFLGRIPGLPIPSKSLCSGFVTVARKPGNFKNP